MSTRTSLPAAIKTIGTLQPNPTPFPTQDPFLFCVYHRDFMPAGNANMEAPRRGNGHDFDASKPYRMYHGDRIPGFPQHPHRGFETITATMAGLIDHTDSVGNGGRYGEGDLQWMTAGKGIVHGEMFPLVHDDKPNTLQLFQIWLNLPSRSKMVEPDFVMHWADQVVTVPDLDKAKVTVWAGAWGDLVPPRPPVASWAADPENEVTVWLLELQPGGSVSLPTARGGDAISRSLYLVEGEGAAIVTDEGTTPLLKQQYAVLRGAGTEMQVAHLDEGASESVKVLVLGGKPIGEPVTQYGPFVMNTQREIQQAFHDYQTTRFGGWPWDEDAYVFPKDRTRFALVDGVETFPGTCEGQEES